jgi:hypothetical protein
MTTKQTTKSSEEPRTMQPKGCWNEVHDIGLLEEAGTWSKARHRVQREGEFHVMYAVSRMVEKTAEAEAAIDVSLESRNDACFKIDQRAALP